MCRFVLYLGDEIAVSSLVTEPVNSIIHQSFDSHERSEPLNGDGFGIAWYVPDVTEEPAVFKDVTPAWSNMNLIHLARVIRSSCVLAHVRAATPGIPVIQLNCHPFSHGPFAFMHNGAVAGFAHLRRSLLGRLSDESFQQIAGSTDSEHVFALFLDWYQRIGNGAARGDAMAEAMVATITELEELKHQAGVDEPSRLNLAVTDGKSAVVSRYVSSGGDNAETLYLHRGNLHMSHDGFSRMLLPELDNGAVLVASEPLSDDAGWQPVAPNNLVVVRESLGIETRPLGN